ncbi:MAG: hypothetical protein ACK41D_12680 [Rubricoccaceae bacterium]
MYPVLRPLLGRGGAGRYLSRAESVQRLLPLVERGNVLLQRYAHLLEAMPEGFERERIAAIVPFVRTDVSKLYELIFSLGGTAPTGVDMQTRPLERAADPLAAAREAEQAFHDALRDEIDAVHHQERTRGVLASLYGKRVRGAKHEGGSIARLGILRSLAARR